MAGRGIKYGSSMGVFIAMVFGTLVIVNLFSSKYFKRFDLTETKIHSLAPQSIKILKELPLDVKAVAFYGGESFQQKEATDLLKEFSSHSSRFRFETVDLDKKPGLAKQYEIRQYGTVVVEANGKREKIDSIDEEKLVNAIQKVLSKQEKVLYFLKGHGEKNLAETGPTGYSGLKEAIEKENYAVQELVLVNDLKVPEDAAVVLVAGATVDLLPGERTALDRYIRSGGRAVFLVDPFTLSETGKFLEQYGILLADDVVVDTNQAKQFLVGNDPLLTAVTDYGSHPITREFSAMSLFSLTRSVTPSDHPPEKVRVEKLASSSASSWSERDLDSYKQGKVGFSKEQDKAGPVTVAAVAAVVAENPEADKKSGGGLVPADKAFKEGRVVVFGDSDFPDNGHLNFSGNRDLFLNSVNWLAEDESRISIRPKNPKFEPFMFTPLQARVIFWVPVAILPLIVGIFGIVVNLRRMRG